MSSAVPLKGYFRHWAFHFISLQYQWCPLCPSAYHIPHLLPFSFLRTRPISLDIPAESTAYSIPPRILSCHLCWPADCHSAWFSRWVTIVVSFTQFLVISFYSRCYHARSVSFGFSCLGARSFVWLDSMLITSLGWEHCTWEHISR